MAGNSNYPKIAKGNRFCMIFLKKVPQNVLLFKNSTYFCAPKSDIMIKILGFKKSKEMTRVSPKEEKRNLNRVKNLLFSRLINGEREKVIFVLCEKFRRLRYEDIEEIYSDGCLVLWKKMNDENFKLKEETLVAFLIKICKNIGTHYLRERIDDDVVNLEDLNNEVCEQNANDEDFNEIFDVMDEDDDDEVIFENLEMVWNKLSEVDRMILEAYYWEGCKMDEIAHRIGFKSADSVKSKKNKVLKRMMTMMRSSKVAESSESDSESSSLLTAAA